MRTIRFALALLPSLILLHLFAGFAAPHDPDLGYHLRIGDYVLQEQRVPTIDNTRIESENSEIAYSWLPDVTLAVLEQRGGVLGLRLWVIAGMLVLSIGAAALLYGRVRILQASIVLFLLSLTFTQLVSPRPRLWGTTLFVFLLIALRPEQFEANRRGVFSRIIALSLIIILWANVHISVVLAPLLVTIYAVGAFFGNAPGYTLGTAVSYVVASVLSLLANPYGWKLLLVGVEFSSLQGELISAHVVELVRFNELSFPWPIWMWGAVALFLIWVVRALADLRALLRERKFPRAFSRDALALHGIVVLTLVLALQSTRHIPLLAVAIALALSRHERPKPVVPTSHAVVGTVLFLLATGVGLKQGAWAPAWYDSELTNSRYPTRALQIVSPILRRASVSGEPWRILTPFGDGHFVSWWLAEQGLAPSAQVLLDGRLDRLGQERFMMVRNAYRGNCWQEIVDRYRIDMIMVNESEELYKELLVQPTWVPLGGSPTVVFISKERLFG